LPPKKSNTLAIVLGIVGVVLVLVVGTCAVGAYYVKQKTKEFAENIADGGMVLVSPPEVKAELAGAKKDYVGSWKSVSGKSTFDIDAEGNMKLEKDEGGAKEAYTMPIAAFRGNDIEARAVITFKIDVPEPPHQVSGKWQMRAKGVTWQR
jgi:flagellar basal body-associated protein FliL